MRWTRGQRSEYIEDRRGQRARWGGRVGIGTVVLALIAFMAQRYLGVDLGLQSGGDGESESQPIDPASDPDRDIMDFMSFVLDDLQATWKHLFAEGGKTYRPARLVPFRDATTTACGFGTAAVGPFYCPGDERVFIDLSFFRQLRDRFGAPGDFAQAYVLAHEIGHHVQKLLGYEETMRAAQARAPQRRNQLSVRYELQADCLAGVWGHSTRKRDLLEPGDVEEGLRAAAAIGDDTLQKQSQGVVVPDSFTHGTSAQRMEALQRGYRSGDPNVCKF
jgi:predicted metalloprotease